MTAPRNPLGALPALSNGGIKLPNTPPTSAIKVVPAMKPKKVSHSHRANTGEYLAVSNLSSKDLLENKYEIAYKKYEPAVAQTKAWLQDLITRERLIIQLGDARKSRSTPLFKQVRDTLLNHLNTHLSKQKLSAVDKENIISLVINEVMGMGPIEPLWVDPNISEIMVNSPEQIYVEIGGKIYPVPGARFRDKQHLLEMIQQMLTPLNKSLDQSHPLEDGRLPDGSRFNATHNAITPSGPSLTIRRFSDDLFTVRRFVEIGSIPEEIAEELGNLLYRNTSMLLAGATSSGKTSLLNALAGVIPVDERIIVIEDTSEIKLRKNRHVLSHEARSRRTGEGRDDVTIRDLVKNALRQRPDRLIIGEIRDEAALDFVNALSTGHEGSLGTIHANNSVATITRLASLIMQAGEMEYTQALATMGFALDVIVNTKRYNDGFRRISEIAEVPQHISIKDDTPMLTPRIIWKFVETSVDSSGNVIGEYRKVNNWSKELLEQKNLLKEDNWLSLEEIYAISDAL